jgi:hypothetical protein
MIEAAMPTEARVDGRQPAGHRGVYHGIRHHRKLRDQNRPG